MWSADEVIKNKDIGKLCQPQRGAPERRILISYCVQAVSPSPSLKFSQPPFAFSKPVHAEPGEDHVRLVLEMAAVPDKSRSRR